MTASATANIDQRLLTVTADAKTKVFGASDPSLTYTTEVPLGNRGLLSGESLRGSLSRVSGESAGAFAIRQGTLTDANNANYLISYVSNNLNIAVAPAQNPAITFLQYWASAFPLYFQRPQVWSTADIFRTSCSWITCRLGQVSGGIKSHQMPQSLKFQPPTTPGKR